MKLKDALEWMLIETAPVAITSKYGQSAQEAVRKHLANIDYAKLTSEGFAKHPVTCEEAIFRKNLKAGQVVKFKYNSQILTGEIISGFGIIKRTDIYPIDFKYPIK